jgi:hypothetical protein
MVPCIILHGSLYHIGWLSVIEYWPSVIDLECFKAMIGCVHIVNLIVLNLIVDLANFSLSCGYGDTLSEEA